MAQTPPPTIVRPGTLADRLSRPLTQFLEIEQASASLLLAMTIVALVWANLPHYGETYHHFWETPFSITLGGLPPLSLTLHEWVNDALMGIFFFSVGMEIKRELVMGELSSRQRAMFPVLGALGGMVAPATIYALFHSGGPALSGWGIPMATDIAFAVAALSVLGSRVPPGLKVFLLALAIADDLGAVAVIAIFYTGDLSYQAMGWAVFFFALCYALNRAGVKAIPVYIAVGAFAWLATHASGVHATVAGVILGFLTPTVSDVPPRGLLDRAFGALQGLYDFVERDHDDHGGHHRHRLIRHLSTSRAVLSPLDFLTNLLEPWVGFVIMPLFALANAGVALRASTLGTPEALGVGTAVALGLLIGKPLGITLFSYGAVQLGIAVLPRGVTWRAIIATGLLAGIGFTVALFITALAFEDELFVDGAKVGILIASAVAAVSGTYLLSRSLPEAPGGGSQPDSPANLSGD